MTVLLQAILSCLFILTSWALPTVSGLEGSTHHFRILTLTDNACRRIVVEDVAIEEGQEFTYARRMVFVGNSNLIQSEARLKACGGPPLSKTALRKGRFPELEIDHALLGMEYHSHIIAGIVSGECLTQCAMASVHMDLARQYFDTLHTSPSNKLMSQHTEDCRRTVSQTGIGLLDGWFFFDLDLMLGLVSRVMVHQKAKRRVIGRFPLAMTGAC